MIEKQQIEEMYNALVDCHYADDCLNETNCYMCKAKRLVREGYRKIDEGSVVLTKEEHQHYCAFKIIESQIRGCLDRERELEKKLAQARKETAKEILTQAREKIKQVNGVIALNYAFAVINDIAKQFGVIL